MPEEFIEELPAAEYEGVLKIGDFSLRCYIVEGRRFFNAEDVEALFRSPGDYTAEDFAVLAKWIKGEA